MGHRAAADRLLRVVVAALLALLVADAAHAQPQQQDPLSAPGVLVATGLTPPPVPASGAWLVTDLGSGEVMAAHNARIALAPASTMKMLTGLALAPEVPDDTVYTGTFEAASIDGTKVGIVPDSTYSGRDLLHGLLMSSGNDTAQALTELAGGTEEATRLMQRTADDLGAGDTVVVNASGLDATGQVASARDLALIGRALLDDERLAPILVTERYDFPSKGIRLGSQRPRFQIGNHNRLLGDYPGIVGVKNGFTERSRKSLVVAAEQDGRRVMVVLMRTEGSTWQQSRELLDWAFASPAGTPGVTTLAASVSAATAGGPTSAPSAPDEGAPPGDGAFAVDAGTREAAAGARADGAEPSRLGIGLGVAGAFLLAGTVGLLVLRASVSSRARSGPGKRAPGRPPAAR